MATGEEATMAPLELVMMAVPVVSVDQRVGLSRLNRIREAMWALHQQFRALAFKSLECHQRNLVNIFVYGEE